MSGVFGQARHLRDHALFFWELQAKKKLADLTYRPTVNPMRTVLETSKMAALTPEGDYFCVAIKDDNYDFLIYSTKHGKIINDDLFQFGKLCLICKRFIRLFDIGFIM